MQNYNGTKLISQLQLRLQTTFAKELFDDSHQVAECKAVVGNKTFDLMKLSEMSRIQCFVPKHTVYRKIFSRLKLLLLTKCTKINLLNYQPLLHTITFACIFKRLTLR